MISSELVEEKYSEWAASSEKPSTTMNWEETARERIQRIPNFVRGMVILELERRAIEMGENSVTNAVVEEVSSLWKKSGDFHHKQ